jgi:phosphopantothenoylcysteine decarboxylase/phosphopantothenate--cysteine ligase
LPLPPPLESRTVLLIIAGGIAAYKSLELIRRLQDRGARVRCILTRAGAEFVTPLSVSALSGEQVHQELFSLTPQASSGTSGESEMGHIRLARDCDLIVVAPATADLLARMATGQADDLASTVLLATDKPVLIAPAMNAHMWRHPATQRNVATLHADGIAAIGPAEGDLACGEVGPGRMVEADAIAARVEAMLAAPAHASLAGFTALVTSGPTREAIDPVRYFGNFSSGKQGHAVAASLARRGAKTILVTGPTAEPDPAGVTVRRVESGRQMLEAARAALPADIAVFAAAVADWRPGETETHKRKKDGGKSAVNLALIENPDVLGTLARPGPNRPTLVVGFAAETESDPARLIERAAAKRTSKNCDWVVANDVSPGTGVLGGGRNTVHVVTAAGAESWPTLDKAEVAERLADRIAAAMAARGAPKARLMDKTGAPKAPPRNGTGAPAA